jgi:hypothetical protein
MRKIVHLNSQHLDLLDEVVVGHESRNGSSQTYSSGDQCFRYARRDGLNAR